MAFAGQVLIFTVTGCAFCKRAKKLLSDQQVPYVEVNLEQWPERREEMQRLTGRSSVPQVFFNARHIGGFDELKKLDVEGKLEDLLEQVAASEVPEGAPRAPPPSSKPGVDEDFDEGTMLPSQRIGSESGGGAECVECTPDELAAIVREIQDSALIGKHSYHLVTYKNTFVGSALVDWLVTTKGYTQSEAVCLGQELHKRHFIHHVTYDHDFKNDHLFYRLLGDARTVALNAHLSHACIPRPAPEVAKDLRKYIVEIYDDYLSSDGFSVDYQGISTSRKFESYVRATAELKRVNLMNLSWSEKVAFFINVYNALVIHMFVVQGPPTSMWRRYKFFKSTSYIIGGRVYSLNDIENGVLRANRRPVAAFSKPFSSRDPRLKVALETPEPRVHFALVCGAKSCPPIKTYSAENLEKELDLAMQSFLEGGGSEVDLEKREVHLSSILKWYRVDFGSSNQEVLEWVQARLPPGPKRDGLGQLLQDRNYRLKYLPYNWDLNGTDPAY